MEIIQTPRNLAKLVLGQSNSTCCSSSLAITPRVQHQGHCLYVWPTWLGRLFPSPASPALNWFKAAHSLESFTWGLGLNQLLGSDNHFSDACDCLVNWSLIIWLDRIRFFRKALEIWVRSGVPSSMSKDLIRLVHWSVISDNVDCATDFRRMSFSFDKRRWANNRAL